MFFHQSMHVRHFRYRVMLGVMTALMLLVPLSTSAQDATPGVLPGQDPNAPCANGRLRVQDLTLVDSSLDQGLQRSEDKAKAWQPDSRLYTLRLGCPLLTSGYQWEGVYFSEDAQAFYSTDTGAIDAVDDDPATIPTLDPAGISLQNVYRSLVRAGFGDGLLLSAQGGVTIRTSTDTHPFGPPEAPRNQVYAHIAIEVSGQTTDVWVSIADGTIYRYP
ncbi:MAG TPA: hypothetical protein VNZ58_10455 [Thermomicrobiales bacterium]|nr:hypothetical protein [Thermomicrobiales bacterium]